MEQGLRHGGEVSNNLHNIIQTLSTKLDSVVRYRMYIEDARKENDQQCVQLFQQLEQQDRQAVDQLQQHLLSMLQSSGQGLRGGQSQSKAA